MAKQKIEVIREISTLETDINLMRTALSVKKLAGTKEYTQLSILMDKLDEVKRMIMKNPNL